MYAVIKSTYWKLSKQRAFKCIELLNLFDRLRDKTALLNTMVTALIRALKNPYEWNFSHEDCD